MKSQGLAFHHPLAFWGGCLAISAGVLSHVPMFVESSHMGYRMAGMPTSATMLAGMALILVGLLASTYGLLPRLAVLRQDDAAGLHFHVADGVPLNPEHWKLIAVLMVAVVIDVMKPATIGFVMPGMTIEYGESARRIAMLPLVALTGTAIGSVIWGMMADRVGRRAAILVSALMFIGTSICGAMPSLNGNLAMCFLMGMSAGGLLPITFTLMAETVPTRHRGWLLVGLGSVGTTLGYLVAAGAAALLEPLFNWRILWMLGLPTGLLVILLNRYIPESPRYLAGKSFRREARAILARFSGAAHAGGAAVVEEVVPDQESSFRRLMHTPYTGISLGLLSAGIAWGVVNFGFLLWLPTNLAGIGLADQAGALIAWSAVLALPGSALVIWLYHAWSSIRTLVLFVLLSAASLFLFPAFAWLEVVSLPAMSFAIALLLVSSSGVIATLLPYAAEIYPVQVRGTGAGMVAAGSKAGGILGALLGMFGVFDDLALAAFAISAPLAVAAVLLVRSGIDTRGMRLEDVHTTLVTGAS